MVLVLVLVLGMGMGDGVAVGVGLRRRGEKVGERVLDLGLRSAGSEGWDFGAGLGGWRGGGVRVRVCAEGEVGFPSFRGCDFVVAVVVVVWGWGWGWHSRGD